MIDTNMNFNTNRCLVINCGIIKKQVRIAIGLCLAMRFFCILQFFLSILVLILKIIRRQKYPDSTSKLIACSDK